ncbi:Disease resistance response protein 206 [Linum grandiflorum]
MVVFFHNILYDGHNKANATSAIVAFPEGANRTVLADDAHFGDIIVFDDPITTGEKLQSPLVGRAQGMYVYDTKTPSAAFFAFTFRVNSTQHQGTINVMGADPVKDKTRDLVITGGTGDFFMHRGIATMSSVTHEGDVYFSARFDIKFYECW